MIKYIEDFFDLDIGTVNRLTENIAILSICILTLIMELILGGLLIKYVEGLFEFDIGAVNRLIENIAIIDSKSTFGFLSILTIFYFEKMYRYISIISKSRRSLTETNLLFAFCSTLTSSRRFMLHHAFRSIVWPPIILKRFRNPHLLPSWWVTWPSPIA